MLSFQSSDKSFGFWATEVEKCRGTVAFLFLVSNLPAFSNVDVSGNTINSSEHLLNEIIELVYFFFSSPSVAASKFWEMNHRLEFSPWFIHLLFSFYISVSCLSFPLMSFWNYFLSENLQSLPTIPPKQTPNLQMEMRLTHFDHLVCETLGDLLLNSSS